MRVVHLAAEVHPFCKTGGLGDVASALPGALARMGVETAVYCPMHSAVRQLFDKRGIALQDTGIRRHPMGRTGPECAIRTLRADDATALGVEPRVTWAFVDCPPLFFRDGLYDDPSTQRAWPDNPWRFAYFGGAALESSGELLGNPDVLHAHDWQTALVPIHARQALRSCVPGASTVLTIHNLAYQGVCDRALLPSLGLSWDDFHGDALEFHGALDMLKGGIAFADAITTVSPSYAREIRTAAFGFGLDGFLRRNERKLHGIVNGIDISEWNPAHDRHLPAAYSADDPAGKAACRAALLDEVGLAADPADAVLVVVSRLVSNKGLDLVADLVPKLAGWKARLIVLGSGEPDLEARFRYLAGTFARHVVFRSGFDIGFAHRMFAGADLALVPSRFEPCGLTQMQAMRYGAVPVVHAVGGLRDTVRDPGDRGLLAGEGTGFRFEHATAQGLGWALQRAVRARRDDPAGWGRLVASCMREDVSWDQPAARYLELYAGLRRG